MKRILLIILSVFLVQYIHSQSVVYNWNGNTFGASGEQARRMTIGRVYYNQSHWGNYGNIVFKIRSNYFKSGYVEYLLMANPAINTNTPVLYCQNAGGSTAKYVKLELGPETFAGNVYEGGNNNYRDIYLDIDYYTIWFIEAIVTGPFALDQTSIGSTEYSKITLFSTPAITNISSFLPHQKIINIPSSNADFFLNGKVGIGTANPTDQLHVVGDNAKIKLSGSTHTSIEMFDGGTGDPGYIKTNYYGAVDNQIGANGTYFALQSGNVGIGTSSPSEKLSVNGNIKAKKLIVSQTGWPDYVFEASYKLSPLKKVHKFIIKHKHLPDIPSAKEVAEKGISIGDQQALLLKKIEEITLYMIRQEQQIENLTTQLRQLKSDKHYMKKPIRKPVSTK